MKDFFFKMPQESIMRQNTSQNAFEFILCWPSTVGPGACSSVWFVSLVRLVFCFLLLAVIS